MRLAVFGDIHGNLPALLAALADMRAQGASDLICLGDVALGGPWPAECLRVVRRLGCPVVRGNTDRLLTEAPAPFRVRGLPDEKELYDIGRWSAEQVGATERAWAGDYRPSVQRPDLLCFHGSPARDTEGLTEQTSALRLEELRQQFGAQPLWVGGHTHRTLRRELGGWTLLNAGSVGLPFEERGERVVHLAHAEYLLLERTEDGWQPVFRRVPYDVQEIRRGVLSSGMPHARWAAELWTAS